MQIYIRDSKTHTARYALLSKRALDILTEYWFTCGRPIGILFPNKWTGEYLTTSGPRLVFKKSLKIAGLPHSIRMHSLRQYLGQDQTPERNKSKKPEQRL